MVKETNKKEKDVNIRASDDWDRSVRLTISDYLSLKCFLADSGLHSSEFGKFVPKEILDNAFDSIDKLPNPKVDAKMGKCSEGYKICITDNNGGIPPEVVRLMLDPNYRASSKFFVQRPLRGAYGWGLESVCRFLQAFAREHDLEPGYVKIRSQGYEHTISGYKIKQGRLKPIIDKIKHERDIGTEVEVLLPGHLTVPEDYVYEYVLFNPHINFTINGKTFEKVTTLTLFKDSSPHFYTPKEFVRLVDAYRNEHPHMSVKKFIRRFHGADGDLSASMEDKTLSDLSTADVLRIYDLLKHSTPKVKPLNLGLLGGRPIKKRIEQLYGKIEKSNYKLYKGYFKGAPFVVEVLTAYVKGLDKRCIYFGLNQSVPVRNPLKHMWLLDSYEEDAKAKYLWEILRSCGISKYEPVVVTVHLHCAKILYGGSAKVIPNLKDEEDMMRRALGGTIHRASSWYKGFKGRRKGVTDWNTATKKAIDFIKYCNGRAIYPTVRQIYYYLAGRLNVISLTRNAYNELDKKLVKARKLGKISWSSLSDRSRYTLEPEISDLSPEEAIAKLLEDAPKKAGINPWNKMKTYIEVWLEKDALVGFVKPITSKYFVVLAPHRGYSSWSYINDGIERLKEAENSGKRTVVLTLGDHDPSGLDIERHLKEAIKEFGLETEVERIALTYAQVDRYNLPASPLKKADPRAKSYRKIYGNETWELDALDPMALQQIIENEIQNYIDIGRWGEIILLNKAMQRKTREIVEWLKKKMHTRSPFDHSAHNEADDNRTKNQ